jgi:hypothetical protein
MKFTNNKYLIFFFRWYMFNSTGILDIDIVLYYFGKYKTSST